MSLRLEQENSVGMPGPPGGYYGSMAILNYHFSLAVVIGTFMACGVCVSLIRNEPAYILSQNLYGRTCLRKKTEHTFRSTTRCSLTISLLCLILIPPKSTGFRKATVPPCIMEAGQEGGRDRDMEREGRDTKR